MTKSPRCCICRSASTKLSIANDRGVRHRRQRAETLPETSRVGSGLAALTNPTCTTPDESLIHIGDEPMSMATSHEFESRPAPQLHHLVSDIATAATTPPPTRQPTRVAVRG